MDFRNILSDIEKTDPEVFERLSPRRTVLKSFGAKVAVAALPLAIASLFRKAYGKTTTAVTDALNNALELEYMEFNFYHIANNITTVGLIPTADQPGFLTIEAHEKGHINFLKTTITALGATPFKPNYYTDATSTPPYVPKAFDFRASGNPAYAPIFDHVFDDYTTFLVAAQTFEDTHIRAVLGQMPGWAGLPVFAQAQQLLATEGRHAAFVRLIRRNRNAPEQPMPWVSNNIPPLSAVPTSNAILQPFYNGEENTHQGSTAIDQLPGINGTIPSVSASAAFDEPMSQTMVMSLLAPFINP